jgi:CBS domain-containing protein
MNTAVTVREVMDREYVGVSESDDLVETVELLLRESADTAVVVRGSEPVGVVTERDVLAMLVEGPDPYDATVEEAMTETIPKIEPDASLDAAADRMSAREARRLVVTNGGEPLGVITEHDLLATRAPEPGDRQEMPEASVDSGVGTAMAVDAETEAEDTFQDQGICEVCGTLTRDLAAFNGQLLCPDCRDM